MLGLKTVLNATVSNLKALSIATLLCKSWRIVSEAILI